MKQLRFFLALLLFCINNNNNAVEAQIIQNGGKEEITQLKNPNVKYGSKGWTLIESNNNLVTLKCNYCSYTATKEDLKNACTQLSTHRIFSKDCKSKYKNDTKSTLPIKCSECPKIIRCCNLTSTPDHQCDSVCIRQINNRFYRHRCPSKQKQKQKRKSEEESEEEIEEESHYPSYAETFFTPPTPEIPNLLSSTEISDELIGFENYQLTEQDQAIIDAALLNNPEPTPEDTFYKESPSEPEICKHPGKKNISLHNIQKQGNVFIGFCIICNAKIKSNNRNSLRQKAYLHRISKPSDCQAAFKKIKNQLALKPDVIQTLANP